MSEPGVEHRLTSLLEAAFQRAGAELADALGAPVAATVGGAKALSAEELQQSHSGECVLVTGSLSGAVEGTVAFVVGRDHAVRLAGLAQQPDGQAADAAETEDEALGEGDLAAVAFALARVGAAASAVWSEKVGSPVQWPADAAALTPMLVDLGEGAEPVAEAVGGEALCWNAHLDEPANVDMLVVVPVAATDALAQALSDAPNAATPLGPLGSGLARVLPVELPVHVVVAKRSITIRQLLELVPGHVLNLEKSCEEPLDLFVGQKLMAHGDGMMVDTHLGFRVGELVQDQAATQRRRKLVR